LRAPLRGIDGFSQALLEDYGAKLDSEGRNYLERIRSGVQRMGQLIDDILALAKISRSSMFFKTVDLTAIAEAIAEDLKRQEPGRGVEFKIQKELVAGADPVLMKSALENLIGNAWKYTSKKDNAVIEFGSVILYGKTTFFVRDNGVGFDMVYADKIFAPFQRLHKQDEYPGTGVGLASVQRIIHRHGGTIWTEAEVGRGAVFYFTL
jgi:light-regulated signal transduction histidine kinase (bacteriophytochrome)